MEFEITEKHLRVYESRSEYRRDDGKFEIFSEGPISAEAKKRIKDVKNAFDNGFLTKIIDALISGSESVDGSKVSIESKRCVDELVNSVTSEVGRALIGLSVMQLCIKSITQKQNIRLHKGSVNKASFSWVEGISMRTLDKSYVTPTLRKYGLLRLNADGFMMTRSLAENYPYTHLYKARLRGARHEWLLLVEEIEKGKTSPLETLKYLLSKLINAASYFEREAILLLDIAQNYSKSCFNRRLTRSILEKHAEESDYAARLLEISMHALMQSAVESGAFGSLEVKPLSQMRSANKKHGNIGDVELVENGQIVEAWDAKYGKGYLREEIEEIVEKLVNHDSVKTVGFVTNVALERVVETQKRIDEIQQLYSVDLEILTYRKWVDRVYDIALADDLTTESKLSSTWFLTYCEYLSQKRRDIAPIDEPCLEWVTALRRLL